MEPRDGGVVIRAGVGRLGLTEGGERRKSRFREHGKDERWFRWELNEGNLENKAQYVSCTKKQEQHNGRCSVRDRVCSCCCCFVCVCAPLGPYGWGKRCDISRPSYSDQ